MMRNVRFLAVLLILTFAVFTFGSVIESSIAFAQKERPEAGDDEQGPPPHPEGRDGGRKPGPGKGPEFMKSLSPEQKEEVQRLMMLSKSRIELAEVYAAENKIDEAVAEIKKVLGMELPSYVPKKDAEERRAPLTMKIVEIYMKGGREEQALAEAEGLVKSGLVKTEQLGHVYTMLGSMYRKKGNNEKAAEMLKKSIEILEKPAAQKK